MAEYILRARLEKLVDVSIESAGTHAMIGSAMDARAGEIAEANGAENVRAHKARQLSREMIARADLILAMDREHRGITVQLLPKAVRKTFTMREFARVGLAVVESVAPKDAGTLIREIADQRGVVRPGQPAEDDVIDPYRETDETYLRSANQLLPAIETTVDILARILA